MVGFNDLRVKFFPLKVYAVSYSGLMFSGKSVPTGFLCAVFTNEAFYTYQSNLNSL
jgi:hypothetical protein